MNAGYARMRRDSEQERHDFAPVEERPISPGVDALLLALQRNAGNRAVNRLLDADSGKPPSDAGEPLDESTRVVMETRFGRDFGSVRIHASGEAARTTRDFSAHAYTTGSHIAFAPGAYAPDSEGGHALLAHELAHVVQQEGGASGSPELDHGASHELAAQAATQAYASGGPIDAGGPTGVGMARSVDDWLVSTPDINSWQHSDLTDEIVQLEQWLGNQIEGSQDTARIEGALVMLRARLAEIEGRALAKPRRTRSRRGRSTREAAPVEPAGPVDRPRVLREGTSLGTDDPDEMRREVDEIVAYLQRSDLPREERTILQQELSALAPAVSADIQRRAGEHRSRRVAQALTPRVNTDARAYLVEQVSRVESIRPLAERPGFAYLMDGNELITLTEEEAGAIRIRTMAALEDARHKIGGANDGAMDLWMAQAEVERDNLFAAWGTSVFTGVDSASDIYDKFEPYYDRASAALGRYASMRRQGNLVEMANALADAEENAVIARTMVKQWHGDVIEGAESVVRGLTITRNAAFTIVLVLGAVVAAPVVAAGVAGTGATGALATGLTALGTGGVVGTGGAVLGGGSAAAGEAAAGGSRAQILEAGRTEGARWGETGFKIGVTGPLARAAGGALGVGAQGLSRTQQLLRGGLASGGTNVAVETGAEAAHGRVIDPLHAASAFGGGFLGGGGSTLAGGIRNTALRETAQFGIGTVASGGTAYVASGGDIDQTIEAAAVGGVSALGVGFARQPTVRPSGLTRSQEIAFRGGQRLGGAARQATRTALKPLRATVLGVALSVPPARGTGGGPGLPGRTPAALVQGAGEVAPAPATPRVVASAASPVQPAIPQAPAQPTAQAPTSAIPQPAAVTPTSATPLTVASATPARPTTSLPSAAAPPTGQPVAAQPTAPATQPIVPAAQSIAPATQPTVPAAQPIAPAVQPSTQSPAPAAPQPLAATQAQAPTATRRNAYPDFEAVPAGLQQTVTSQAQTLSQQLGGLNIPADRILSAPWVGRIRNARGEIRSTSTSMGYLRSESRFWAEFQRRWPQDYALLGPGRRVTAAFAQRYSWGPETIGQKLVHHHIENASFTVAIPESLHHSLSGTIHARPTVVEP